MNTPVALEKKRFGEERIGIFGGAFDPPHNAHVALAQLAVAHLELDTLHIIPTGQAWHKSRVLTAPEHRLAMTRLAFENLPRLLVDDRELQRAGPTFTIDTLQALKLEYPQARLYLIMGADQFVDFKKWHQWDAILKIAIICIAGRAQVGWVEGQFEAYKELKTRFLMLPLPLKPVSATQIRKLLASGNGNGKPLEIGNLVPEAVARYIALNQLYCLP